MKLTLSLCTLLLFFISCQEKSAWHKPGTEAAFEIVVGVTPGAGYSAVQAVEESYQLLKDRVEKLKIYYQSIEPDVARQRIVFRLTGHSPDKEKEVYGLDHYTKSLLAKSTLEFWDLYRLSDPPLSEAVKKLDSLYALSIPLSLNYDLYRSAGVTGVASGPNIAHTDSLLSMPGFTALLPADATFRWSHIDNNINKTTDEAELYALKKTTASGPALTGKHLIHVRAEISSTTEEPVISLGFDEGGTKSWADLTGKAFNEGKREIAIVLNGGVLSAPRVMSPIPGGQAMITGNFTEQQALDIASQLQMDMLKHELKILEAKKL